MKIKSNILALCAAAVLLAAAGERGQAQNLFVSSSQGYIYEIAPGGTVSTFVYTGGGPSQMAINSSGNLFVAFDGSIIELTPEGVQSTFATGVSDVGGMTFNTAGDLFVSNFGTGAITEITPAGGKSIFSSGLDDPRGLAFNGQGILYAGTATNITTFGANGQTHSFTAVSGGVGSLAFNSSFDLFAANGTNILEFRPNGSESSFASLPAKTGDDEMAFNNAGDLFVADGPSEASVVEYLPNGTESTFASIFGQANGLAFAVPEPPVRGLLALAVGTAALLARRRHAR